MVDTVDDKRVCGAATPKSGVDRNPWNWVEKEPRVIRLRDSTWHWN